MTEVTSRELAKLLRNEETLKRQNLAMLKLMMVLLLTPMASEFVRIVSICPKICFLRALCANGSLLQ